MQSIVWILPMEPYDLAPHVTRLIPWPWPRASWSTWARIHCRQHRGLVTGPACSLCLVQYRLQPAHCKQCTPCASHRGWYVYGIQTGLSITAAPEGWVQLLRDVHLTLFCYVTYENSASWWWEEREKVKKSIDYLNFQVVYNHPAGNSRQVVPKCQT